VTKRPCPDVIFPYRRLRSGMGYCGCANQALRNETEFLQITTAGPAESPARRRHHSRSPELQHLSA